MPRKIRELKTDLRRAGFDSRPGKGSHEVFGHPLVKETLSIAGGDGDDAKRYQEREVRAALEELRAEQRRKS
jgi:predicted RNA binding protein YcfA (HicA-like mRNA interferase family)